MDSAGIAAAHIGIQRFYLVHQALRPQEIQHPVNGRRRGRAMLIAQFLQNIIGLDRLMAPPDQFQHALPEPREALPGGVTQPPGHDYRRVQAILMPVRGGLEWPYYRIFMHALFLLDNKKQCYNITIHVDSPNHIGARLRQIPDPAFAWRVPGRQTEALLASGLPEHF